MSTSFRKISEPAVAVSGGPATPHWSTVETDPEEMILRSQPARRSLADLVVSPELRRQIQRALVLVRKHDTLFDTWNLRAIEPHRHGVAINLYGPPGTGKSHCAEAMAAELTMRILTVNYAELVSKYVGDTQKNIVDAFSVAQDENAVLFFDEADAMLRRRTEQASSQGADESANLSRSVLLRELDRCKGVVVFATNRAEDYDRAFVRRMLAHVEFDLPDAPTRTVLWNRLLVPELPIQKDLDFGVLVANSEGLSGGEIVNAIVNAAAEAVQRTDTQRVCESDLLEGLRRIREDSTKVASSDIRHGVVTKQADVPVEQLPPDVKQRFEESAASASSAG